MVKKKNLITMLMVFVLGAALLAGCGAKESKEVGQKDTAALSGDEQQTEQKDNAEIGGQEKQAEQNEAAKSGVDQSAEIQATATTSGTIKAIDAAAGTLTITTESNGDLELKVINPNEIVEGESLATLAELAAKTKTKVIVEYEIETKILTSIEIQE